MNRREYIAKFIGDLAKIVFGAVIITQAISEKPIVIILSCGLIGFWSLFLLSIFTLPKDNLIGNADE
jgi:hypothetical protein